MKSAHKPRATTLLIMLLVAICVLLLAPLVGLRIISPVAVLRGEMSAVDIEILRRIRIPRVCIAFLAGAALAVSGMAFQAMFHNPLATPFTLGVAGGASLGTAVYMRLGLAFSILGVSGVSLFGFAGAILAICLVYGLTRARKGFSTATMLLAGVAISLFFSSLIMFVQYIGDFAHSFRILHWLMGGLRVVGFRSVWNIFPFVLSGSLILLYLTHELNMITTGDDLAISRGVDVKRTKKIVFVATSLMVGGVVAFCGPIGFVGMMVPHICRLMVGSNHRYLMPATFLLGGSFLSICDTLARTLIAPAEIPVGVITALLGGPFFIWLLLGKGRLLEG